MGEKYAEVMKSHNENKSIHDFVKKEKDLCQCYCTLNSKIGIGYDNCLLQMKKALKLCVLMGKTVCMVYCSINRVKFLWGVLNVFCTDEKIPHNVISPFVLVESDSTKNKAWSVGMCSSYTEQLCNQPSNNVCELITSLQFYPTCLISPMLCS